MRRTLTAAAATLLLTLSACSSGGEDAPPPTEENVAVETAPAEPLSQEEWVEMCAPDVGTEPDNPRCTEDIDAGYEDLGEWDGAQGEWVPFRTMDSDDTLHDWSIRVDAAEIMTTIPGAADNPDYMGGDLDAPERVDAEPEESSEFLAITYTVRNDSNRPDMIPATHAVHFADGEVFYPVGDDEFITSNLTGDLEKNVDADYQNPGSEAEGVLVFSVPEDSDIAAVEFMDAYIMSEFYTTIELTDVTR